MTYLVYFIILLNIFSSCKTEDVEMTVPAKTYKILALGDSYTIGERVAEKNRYPVQLADSLRKKNIQVEDPKIIATTGWTTADLLSSIQNDGVSSKFDFILLLIGVNNQYRGYSSDEYRKEFKELLQKSIVFSGNHPAHVFVLSIPDWGITPFAEGSDRAQIAKEIDLFNSINEEESLAVPGVNYVNITDISRLPDPDLIASDGLHPSGKMYGLWVERMLPKVMERIK